jgi:hypothetical protein
MKEFALEYAAEMNRLIELRMERPLNAWPGTDLRSSG